MRQGSPVCLILLVSLYSAGYYSEVSLHTVHQFYEIQSTKEERLCCGGWGLTDGARVTFMNLITQGPIGLDIIAQARFIAI